MLDSPGGASGKESTCQCRRYKRQVPSPGEGNGNPLQYSCMENSVDRGSWWASVHGVPKSPTQLSKAAHVFLAHHGLGFYTIHFSVRRLYIGHTWATFGSLQGVQHLEDLGTDWAQVVHVQGKFVGWGEGEWMDSWELPKKATPLLQVQAAPHPTHLNGRGQPLARLFLSVFRKPSPVLRVRGSCWNLLCCTFASEGGTELSATEA